MGVNNKGEDHSRELWAHVSCSITKNENAPTFRTVNDLNKGAYNADDAALNISDLQHAEHDADKKLKEDVERVKTELFQFDAERNELNNLLRNHNVMILFWHWWPVTWFFG